MLHLVQLDRSYSPETISVMTAAFDRVCQSVSKRMNGNDDVKKTLALIILRHVDRGERDSERLADAALREWTGADRSKIGDRSVAGWAGWAGWTSRSFQNGEDRRVPVTFAFEPPLELSRAAVVFVRSLDDASNVLREYVGHRPRRPAKLPGAFAAETADSAEVEAIGPVQGSTK
jgi:hypothetical protein